MFVLFRRSFYFVKYGNNNIRKSIELKQIVNTPSKTNDFLSDDTNLIDHYFNQPSALLDNTSNDNNHLINKDVDKDFGDFELVEKDQYKNLKKFRFIHFFLNNFHFKCLNHFKQQEILYLCNEILSKYLSIDSILYNKMMIENLLKDYNWNNLSLNNLENNELFIKLKKLL